MIEFKVTLTEDPESKLIKFFCESADAPEATESEIKYAKAFQMSCAVFKETLSTPPEQPKTRFHKSYGSGSENN